MGRLLRRLTALVAMLAVLAAPATALAATYDLQGSVDCGKASDSTVCSTTPGGDPVSGPNGIIHKVTMIIATIAGIAAVIVMVTGGITYITSNGEADAVSRAKKTIIFAAVGLVVIVLGQTIINLVLSRI